MKRIPRSQAVRKAIRSVRQATQLSLKALNAYASQRMARGDYAAAESAAAKGRELRAFLADIETLRKRWREVSGGGGAKKEVTPLWAFYQPVLQAVIDAGGECKRDAIEATIARTTGPALLTGDKDKNMRGRERWQVMIRRALKAMANEGWVVHEGASLWSITSEGRRAALKPAQPA
jgi:hypothetical protein